MKKPLIILAGQAGSGKDTVGAHLSRWYRATTLGQADPLKRFAEVVFRFSHQQLWGPSELRNQRDPRFDVFEPDKITQVLDDLDLAYSRAAGSWLSDVLPRPLPSAKVREARQRLDRWLDDILVRVASYRGLTPRLVLQTLGTEWGRALLPDIWIDYAIRKADMILNGPNAYDRTKGLVYAVRPAPMVIVTDGRFLNEIDRVRAEGGIAIRIDRPGNELSTAAEQGGVTGHVSERQLTEIPEDHFDALIENGGGIEDLCLAAEGAVRALLPQVG